MRSSLRPAVDGPGRRRRCRRRPRRRRLRRRATARAGRCATRARTTEGCTVSDLQRAGAQAQVNLTRQPTDCHLCSDRGTTRLGRRPRGTRAIMRGARPRRSRGCNVAELKKGSRVTGDERGKLASDLKEKYECGAEHPAAGRVVGPVVRLRAPDPHRVRRDAARPRRGDPQEALLGRSRRGGAASRRCASCAGCRTTDEGDRTDGPDADVRPGSRPQGRRGVGRRRRRAPCADQRPRGALPAGGARRAQADRLHRDDRSRRSTAAAAATRSRTCS